MWNGVEIPVSIYQVSKHFLAEESVKKGTSRIDFPTVFEPKQYFPFKMCL